ncbi:MAG TPA: glycosyltransferase family 2 protein [Oligoflexia bacterium]|nr:glycosyltransferase family 2 protein [Oligoflexia bacterium]HMP27467.1 glycosyltransferase family 2 protein [Oligoflexia bacterium]
MTLPASAKQQTSQRATISAFIICKNEQSNIERCLKSVSWCDEIILVDSGSTDQTLEIARAYTNKIYQHPWSGYVEQKRYALSLCSSEWVINIDGDEEISNSLRNEIITLLEKDSKERLPFAGYELSRVMFFLDRWWRKGGWYPEYRLRLLRRSVASWGGIDPHEKAIVSGQTKRLKGELLHYSYNSISDQVARLNLYAERAAISLHEQGKNSSLIKMLINPLLRFIKFYILKLGFLEGRAGLIVALNESYYVFLKYAKHWEIERAKRKKQPYRSP